MSSPYKPTTESTDLDKSKMNDTAATATATATATDQAMTGSSADTSLPKFRDVFRIRLPRGAGTGSDRHKNVAWTNVPTNRTLRRLPKLPDSPERPSSRTEIDRNLNNRIGREEFLAKLKDWKTENSKLHARNKDRKTESSKLPDQFYDFNTTELTRESILAVFPTKWVWQETHMAALQSSRIHHKGLLSRLAYLSVFKRTIVPKLLLRSHMIKSGNWTLNEQILCNHRDWMLYWIGMSAGMMDKVVKHANWLKLLEDEYIKIEPVWREFWALQDIRTPIFSLDRLPLTRKQTPSPDLYEELANHNKKRLFLQSRIVEGREVLAKFYEDPPAWLEWRSVGTDDNDAGEQPETGFVEEIEEDRESEEFVL
ncbi:hypothetical protein A1O1_01571 [Capronia coronata CBS 617.96]|uniref:Uncharacterized protein n=1 Tax=Capronia coronata CBS 617.96 TaxID=1182541 RepID=W9Z3B9_9EURO|nr:uncharacterized protein A1O1_01571 [Capronia coronata CBS 617.96]EXJ96445.1 hypothetical protein A1O1_01571 [Capronia coronata CBS 617.96]